MTSQEILAVPVGQTVYSPNYLGNLIVTERVAAPGTRISQLWDGTAEFSQVKLSADGRGVIESWHEGDSDDAVYVEVHRADGSGFHGWVDRDSRRLVQVG